ncbi:hypothetical protein SOV_17380 [Sporomusa ovata DSM 2662]|uniref:Phage protein n=1 Tax=Sporomusa ovata TaxID=2378 RepID=A0A0U1KW64_9FIRM|nr:hypothetical protein [Sporomusa ovata]EQB29338.1 hypothetical protein SOV_1c10710 [Sporomusa ovata DSM 2662]CQR71379.1 Phage protein [Sporomusa ovata]
MNSVIQICNIALSHFGGGEINSLDEASEAARSCNLFYENSRDEVLRDFPWPFARRIQVLALTGESVPGWDYCYQLPAKCLRARRVFASNDMLEYSNPFDIYEDKLLCNVASAYLEYTVQVVDPVLFDAKFSQALSFKLASELVIKLLGNATRKQEFYTQYQQTLGEAKTAAMRERYQERQYKSSWVDGR